MTCDVIGNELLVSQLIPLTHDERNIIVCLRTFSSLTMEELCIVTRKNPVRTRNIISDLNSKTRNFFSVVRTSGIRQYDSYYIYVKKKGENNGFRWSRIILYTIT